MAIIRITSEAFDPTTELARLHHAEVGAIASFIGHVRDNPKNPLAHLTLEHYPGMTEREILKIAEAAELRFALLGCSILHRYGRLLPGEPIVFCAASSPHRKASLAAVEFLIDYLKTSAPFWKLETFRDGSAGWVAPVEADDASVERWME